MISYDTLLMYLSDVDDDVLMEFRIDIHYITRYVNEWKRFNGIRSDYQCINVTHIIE